MKFARASLLGQYGGSANKSFQGISDVLIASLWALIIFKILWIVVLTVWYDISLHVVCEIKWLTFKFQVPFQDHYLATL